MLSFKQYLKENEILIESKTISRDDQMKHPTHKVLIKHGFQMDPDRRPKYAQAAKPERKKSSWGYSKDLGHEVSVAHHKDGTNSLYHSDYFDRYKMGDGMGGDKHSPKKAAKVLDNHFSNLQKKSTNESTVNEATSDCCGAPISDVPYGGHGRCSSCGEMSPLRKDEPEKKAKKQDAKEATQPTLTNLPDTPKFTDKDIKFMKTLKKIEPYKSKFNSPKAKAMPSKKQKVKPLDLDLNVKF